MKPSELIQEFEKLMERFTLLHTTTLDFFDLLQPIVKDREGANLEDLCDLGFLCREIERLTDEMRKDAKAHKELIGKVIAYRRISETMNDENPDLVVRGSLASGSPEMRMRTVIPKRGTPEFADLCRSFGMGDIAIDGALFTPHYIRLADHVTSLIEAGVPKPPGVELSEPVYSTVFRRKR